MAGMTTEATGTRTRALAALAAGLALLLAGCLVTPGRFDSTLDLRRDGRFSFAYKGEIFVLPLSDMDGSGTVAPFAPEPCHVDKGVVHPCTPEEIDAQRAAWEQKKAKKASEAAMAKAMLGVDPNDPRAAAEFAQRLSRQAGWRSVVDEGGGRFLVDYAIAGRLDHDFAFPTIERMPMVIPFVALTRRADGSVRVETPGLGSGSGPAMMAAMGQATPAGGAKKPPFPAIDGRFALTTDGEVLANNTDEGPRKDPAGTRLDWKVGGLPPAASPTALVKL